MSLEVRRFGPGAEPDFWRMHCEARGTGWCYCMAWWFPTWDGWTARSDAENRAARQVLLDRGEYDGYLLYQDGVPTAWCQAGRRDRLEKLVRQYRLPPDPAVWALSCFAVAPEGRGRGLARALLAGVLEDLPRRGVARVQAFPRRGAGLAAGEAWRGPERLFIEAGFRLETDHPQTPVYGKRLG